jgi:hypothetical protein
MKIKTPDQLPIYSRIDTLAFLVRYNLSREMVAALKLANGGRFRLSRNIPKARMQGWQEAIVLQSPTRAALEIAARIPSDCLLVVRLDPCRDHIQPDQQSADIYADYFQKHAIQRNVMTETLMVGNTTYSARQRGRTILVIYSTKLCKATGEYCVHIEIRIRGGAKLKRMGLGTIQQILDFDHNAFWEKHLVLIEPKYRTEQQIIDAVVVRNRYKYQQGLWNGCNPEKRITSVIHRMRATAEDSDGIVPTVFPQESRKWEMALKVFGTRPQLIDKTPYMNALAIDNPTSIIKQAICHTHSTWRDFEDVKELSSC